MARKSKCCDIREEFSLFEDDKLLLYHGNEARDISALMRKQAEYAITQRIDKAIAGFAIGITAGIICGLMAAGACCIDATRTCTPVTGEQIVSAGIALGIVGAALGITNKSY